MAEMTVEDLQDLLWTFAQHRVLTVAGRVGILRRLAESGATPDRVAADLKLDPHAAGKLIRSLHAMGLLTAEGDNYSVVDGLAPHFVPGPKDITPFFEHSHDMYDSWGQNLEPWLYGEPWQSGARDPESARRFGAAMRAIGSEIARRTASAIDTDGVSSMLDVGGGFGQYSIAMCAENPRIHATVLDTPAVARLGRTELEGSGLEERISFLEGDYLTTDYGDGYDLVLIANVLHQESALRAAEMVRRSVKALAPGGRLAVVDFRIDEQQRENVFGTLFAINMRSFGDTYTEPTIRSWMGDAGLIDLDRIDLSRHKWLIVGAKPEGR